MDSQDTIADSCCCYDLVKRSKIYLANKEYYVN